MATVWTRLMSMDVSVTVKDSFVRLLRSLRLAPWSGFIAPGPFDAVRPKSFRHVTPASSDASQWPAMGSGGTVATNRRYQSGSSRQHLAPTHTPLVLTPETPTSG